MRFVFVDRVLAVEPHRSIETLKNVTMSEDVFVDHFPGWPILPGALVVETFVQSAGLLVALSHEFARVGRLRRVRDASFRQVVRPGDQLRVRCERVAAVDGWRVRATAAVDGRRVATGVLELGLEEAVVGSEAWASAERLRALARELDRARADVAGWSARA